MAKEKASQPQGRCRIHKKAEMKHVPESSWRRKADVKEGYSVSPRTPRRGKDAGILPHYGILSLREKRTLHKVRIPH